jgi:translation initiation factor 5B
MAIRQPIITVVGHVDHGKTSILDRIRSTAVAAKEAGGITQKISFTTFPASILEEKSKSLLKQFKIKLEIPGFLFIDTPGHAAFTNLRKRGGALADIAILVIDVNEGIMPQTAESIEILRANKTPFLIALNKVDAISGWRRISENLAENIDKQPVHVRQQFDTKVYKIVEALFSHGFNADLFTKISDFTKQIAMIPTSGKSGEGIPELLVMLAGLSQRFLKGELEIGKETKGTVLELKKEKDMMYVEAIVYDGHLNQNDNLVVAGLEKPIVTRVRALFEALPLSKGFKPVKSVTASAGIRMQVPDSSNILSGMPFLVAKSSDIKKASQEIQKEVSEAIKLDKEGVIAKAESLGSLEALLILLRKSNIPVSKVGIGNITKTDVISASSNIQKQPLNAIVIGFNVDISDEVKNEEKIKLLTNDVIYKLIEDFEKWRIEKYQETARSRLEVLTMPCRLKVLKFMFRMSKPAIFGVRVESGILVPEIPLMNQQGKHIDRVKAVQSEGKGVKEAKKGQEVALSLPSITYGRQIKEGDTLYSELNEFEFRKLKENKSLLSAEEMNILKEIAEIKRKEKSTWGL